MQLLLFRNFARCWCELSSFAVLLNQSSPDNLMNAVVNEIFVPLAEEIRRLLLHADNPAR